MFERGAGVPSVLNFQHLAKKGYDMRYAFILTSTMAALSAAQAAEPDLRCTRADAAATQRLRMMIDETAMRSTIAVYHAMSKMTVARIDCRRGRAERGLETYRQLDAVLAGLGQVAAK
jgi:hypothetical protein